MFWIENIPMRISVSFLHELKETNCLMQKTQMLLSANAPIKYIFLKLKVCFMHLDIHFGKQRPSAKKITKEIKICVYPVRIPFSVFCSTSTSFAWYSYFFLFTCNMLQFIRIALHYSTCYKFHTVQHLADKLLLDPNKRRVHHIKSLRIWKMVPVGKSPKPAFLQKSSCIEVFGK